MFVFYLVASNKLRLFFRLRYMLACSPAFSRLSGRRLPLRMCGSCPCGRSNVANRNEHRRVCRDMPSLHRCPPSALSRGRFVSCLQQTPAHDSRCPYSCEEESCMSVSVSCLPEAVLLLFSLAECSSFLLLEAASLPCLCSLLAAAWLEWLL